MAENPLLPNAELRALQQLLVRATDLSTASGTSSKAPAAKRASKHPAGTAPALLAGTVVQLCAGDLLVPTQGDSHAVQLLSREGKKPSQQDGVSAQVFGQHQPALLLACGLAAALQRAGSDRLVLAFVTPGPGAQKWADALSWAQEDTLPLVVVCAETNGVEALRTIAPTSSDDLSWTTLQRSAARLKLPVLTVDGEDAVAVYRVMQESVLRARTGGGPAVLWAVLPQQGGLRKKRPMEDTPLGRLEHYLRTRNITFR